MEDVSRLLEQQRQRLPAGVGVSDEIVLIAGYSAKRITAAGHAADMAVALTRSQFDQASVRLFLASATYLSLTPPPDFVDRHPFVSASGPTGEAEQSPKLRPGDVPSLSLIKALIRGEDGKGEEAAGDEGGIQEDADLVDDAAATVLMGDSGMVVEARRDLDDATLAAAEARSKHNKARQQVELVGRTKKRMHRLSRIPRIIIGTALVAAIGGGGIAIDAYTQHHQRELIASGEVKPGTHRYDEITGESSNTAVDELDGLWVVISVLTAAGQAFVLRERAARLPAKLMVQLSSRHNSGSQPADKAV